MTLLMLSVTKMEQEKPHPVRRITSANSLQNRRRQLKQQITTEGNKEMEIPYQSKLMLEHLCNQSLVDALLDRLKHYCITIRNLYLRIWMSEIRILLGAPNIKGLALHRPPLFYCGCGLGVKM